MAKFWLLAAICEQRMIGFPQSVQGHDTLDLAVAFLDHHGKRGRVCYLPAAKAETLSGNSTAAPTMLASKVMAPPPLEAIVTLPPRRERPTRQSCPWVRSER